MEGVQDFNDQIFRPDGTKVNATSSLAELPQKGDVVSFSYTNHSEAPSGNQVYRIRSEVSWLEAISEFRKEQHYRKQNGNFFIYIHKEVGGGEKEG